MFALQVNFIDAVKPEIIFIRRQQAIIGGEDSAHVVIDDMRALPYQLKIIRQIGRRFILEELRKDESSESSLQLSSVYDGIAEINLGPVTLCFVSLDSDIAVKEGEPLDKASVRVARAALSQSSPYLPAIVTRGTQPCVVSILENQGYLIGRSRAATIRVESADISAKHARIGFEHDSFWVEDLGSTNGTFVEGQRIAGKTIVPHLTPIILGRELSVVGVVNDEDARLYLSTSAPELPILAQAESYPCLVSLSAVVRPARLPLTPGMEIRVGRESNCDIWLGAPHVSREHCLLQVQKSTVIISDSSTNGTGYDEGLLRKGEQIKTSGRPYVLNFGAGVTLALCFSMEHEQLFRESDGSPTSFSSSSTQKPDTNIVEETNNARGTIFQPMQALGTARERKTGAFDAVGKAYREVPRNIRFVLIVVLVGLLTLILAIVALLLSAWIR